MLQSHAKILVVTDMSQRLSQLKIWLKNVLSNDAFELLPLAGDASFRRYYRVRYGNYSAVLMDAPPPEQTSCAAFIAIARSFQHLGLCVPDILAADDKEGFILLTDFGDKLYLHQLTAENVDALYRDAIHALLRLQSQTSLKYCQLPRFDVAMMQREVNLFTQWFLERHIGLKPDEKMRKAIDESMVKLIENVQQQPYVCVHRDYHSRNLLVLSDHKVGILDFQDAVLGPVSYDLVSLLKDCYISWPRDRVVGWVNYYYELATKQHILPSMDFQTFLHWFDWMGIQRHLKALGIFARLNYLYNKPGYLQDIPRTFTYLKNTLSEYAEWAELSDLFQQLQSEVISP
jgi:N-acetylmuramate 1-kinase